MTKTATVNSRIEPELKKQAEAIFAELGLSTSDAITLFYKQVWWNRGLPFSVNIPNAETIAAMEEVERGETTPIEGGVDGLRKLWDEL